MDRKILRFELYNMKGFQVKSFDVHCPEGILTREVFSTITVQVLVPYLASILRDNMKIEIKQVV